MKANARIKNGMLVAGSEVKKRKISIEALKQTNSTEMAALFLQLYFYDLYQKVLSLR